MADFCIERGVAIPKAARGRDEKPHLIATAALAVGECMFFPGMAKVDSPVISSCLNYGRRVGLKLTARAMSDGCRMWRTA